MTETTRDQHLEGELCVTREFLARVLAAVGLGASSVAPSDRYEQDDVIRRIQKRFSQSNASSRTVTDDAPEESPIPLNDWQQQAIRQWAADDRLWTTQETVEFNLRTFARTILTTSGAAPWQPEKEKP
jgi:hypothetical protein